MASALSTPLYAYWPNGISWFEEDHFIAGLGAITGRGTTSGAGAASALSTTQVAQHPGIWTLTGGTAAGVASIAFPGAYSFASGTGKIGFRVLFLTPATLYTSAANSGQVFWGFWNSPIAGTAPTSGAYFQLDTALSATGNVPYCVCSSGSLSVSSGVTLLPSTWYESLILVDNNANTVEYYLSAANTSFPTTGSTNLLAPNFGNPCLAITSVNPYSFTTNIATAQYAGFTVNKTATTGAASVAFNLDIWAVIMGQGTASLTGSSLASMN